MKPYRLIFALLLVTVLSGCRNLLELESENSVTNNYLYTSKDGLQHAIAGLYTYERDQIGSEPILYLLQMFDFSTDLLLYRSGTGTAAAELDTMNPDNGAIATYWTFQYALIGRANEIIAAAVALGLDDPEIHAIYGEACIFRARAYFELWKRYERLYLNTQPTTENNLVREYRPASTEELFTLLKDDLDAAIEALDWQLPSYNGGVMYGRFTKAVAKHLRAQVAMWEEDWDTAIAQCEEVFTEGAAYYSLEKRVENVFSSADFRSKEVLYAYQFSKNVGGGGTISGTTLTGHTINQFVTTEYRSITGCICVSEYGGYGFGRDYPNSHLLKMYGPKDTRYDKLFIHEFCFTDPSSPKYGQVIPANETNNYTRYLHPMSVKHADFYTNTDQPDRRSSFRDLIVYRLAETYLMCAEAYFHRDGGGSPQAIECFNATYARAGNTPFSGTLTLEELLDEYARELHFEGVRWAQLKRLGLLASYCRQFAGDTREDNPNLEADHAAARNNFVEGKHEKWPIPSNQLLLMGSTFPQTDVWQ